MNILHTIDTDYELTWDEFLITVEDLHLIETGADLADDDYATVLAAFERGLSPNGCVMSIIDARRPLDARALVPRRLTNSGPSEPRRGDPAGFSRASPPAVFGRAETALPRLRPPAGAALISAAAWCWWPWAGVVACGEGR